MAFTFTKLSIPEVLLIDNETFVDERGYFSETFQQSFFAAQGIPPFVQENHSYSKKQVLRGLHSQIEPHAQGKLVRCVRGEIFDVAVDIRRESATFGKWVSAMLSAENRRQLYIPPGFAHGFCVVSDEAEVVYKCTTEYAPAYERGIAWDDPRIGIAWPSTNFVLSKKDRANPPLS